MSRSTARIVGLAVAVTAAFGLVLGGAAVPALAASSPYFVVLGTELYPAPTVANGGHGCSTGLYSTQVSAGAPAYVAAIGSNIYAGAPCVVKLERSADKGKSWTVIAPALTVPAVAEVITDAKTGNYYDGPGFEARACVALGAKAALHCGKAVSLAKGTGKPAGGPETVAYSKETTIVPAAGYCGTALFGTTIAKTASSRAGADVVGLSLKTTCTMYLQDSRNGGKTWSTVSASYTLPAKFAETASYTLSTVPDGPGTLARSCVRSGTSKSVSCTAPW